MSAGTPDSPREWQAEFVGDPTRNCVVGSTAEHFPPARLDGYRLIAANETTRVATYRLASAGTAADSAASGPAGTRTESSCSGSGQDDSGQLRARLVELVRQPFEGSVSTPTLAYTNAVADAILADGFTRVSVDDATVERVARAIWASAFAPDSPLITDDNWAWAKAETDGFHRRARAAVQALRDGGEA